MTFRDLIAISTGNLWRMKLRTFLTTSGVVIAIAAFVSMLSFGAGNQQLITDQFNDLGLFNTVQVYPRDSSDVKDTLPHPRLDERALDSLAVIPGVNLAFPYDAFSVYVTCGDSTVHTKAQALSLSATRLKIFSRLESGKLFDSDSSGSILVAADFAKKLGIDTAEHLIGDTVIVAVKVSSLDSGLAHVISDRGERLTDRFDKIEFDSIMRSREYRRRIISTEANSALRRFMNGYLNARTSVADTFVVSGILKAGRARRLPVASVLVPAGRARRFTHAGFTGEMSDMIGMVTSGQLLPLSEDADSHTFSQVTLDVDPTVPHSTIRKKVEAMGYRTFSYAEQFEEIQKFFFYFDIALGMIGLIAMLTASLGIINTMVMSILERKREIGVLKSLGADDRDIRALFLVESSVIGALGAGIGLLFGWLITRVASVVAHYFMRKEGVTEVEIFALPWWLILIALGLGIGVSLIAGIYPASRAARTDPVEALRNE
jgi:ABC-type antimicrobial peptide transport system permease subunit